MLSLDEDLGAYHLDIKRNETKTEEASWVIFK